MYWLNLSRHRYGKGPAEYFTGAVRIDPLFEAPNPARVVGTLNSSRFTFGTS